MMSQPLEDLQLAGATFRVTVEGVSSDGWAAATPCPEWTVAQLVDHVVRGNIRFANAVDGGGRAMPAAVTPESAVAEAQGSVEALLDAFASPDALERTVTVPFGTVPGLVALRLRVVELLAHGWDVATATGQEMAFPRELTEAAIDFTGPALRGVPPSRSPFGTPCPVPEDAAPIARLAGLLGRDPVTS